jgi:hypothetical protein
MGSISRVGPQGLCVWSNSLKGGAGNTYMPLHDHLYSDVNIIYSVVQTGERTNHGPGDKFSPKHLKALTGNTDLDNYTYYLVE